MINIRELSEDVSGLVKIKNIRNTQDTNLTGGGEDPERNARLRRGGFTDLKKGNINPTRLARSTRIKFKRTCLWTSASSDKRAFLRRCFTVTSKSPSSSSSSLSSSSLSSLSLYSLVLSFSSSYPSSLSPLSVPEIDQRKRCQKL